MTRFLRAAAIFLVLPLLIVIDAEGASARATGPGGAASQEAAFVADINALRASRGLPVLTVDANLVGKARSWAATMASARRIWHSKVPAGISASWRKLGENVGMGISESSLHAAFRASPRHYENLVDPAFTSVGIGVVDTGALLFVSEVFMQPEPVARRPVRQSVTPTRPSSPVRAATPPEAFRSVV